MNHLLNVTLVLLIGLISHTRPIQAGDPAAIPAARPRLHYRTTIDGITLELKDIYIDHHLLWLAFSATNHSAIDFHPATMHLAIRDKKALKRRAVQERPLTALVKQEPSVLAADSTTNFCYGLIPRIPGKKQELVVQWMDRNGERHLTLHIPARDILNAKKINSWKKN